MRLPDENAGERKPDPVEEKTPDIPETADIPPTPREEPDTPASEEQAPDSSKQEPPQNSPEMCIRDSTSIITVPFGGWKMTRFIPEGMVGHLVTSTFKLLLVSLMIALCVGGIKDLKPPDTIFKQTEVQTGMGGGEMCIRDRL